MTDNAELLSTKQVSAMTGIAESTLNRYRYNNQGPPFYHVGKRMIKYKRAEVTEWIEKNHTKPENGDNNEE